MLIKCKVNSLFWLLDGKSCHQCMSMLSNINRFSEWKCWSKFSFFDSNKYLIFFLHFKGALKCCHFNLKAHWKLKLFFFLFSMKLEKLYFVIHFCLVNAWCIFCRRKKLGFYFDFFISEHSVPLLKIFFSNLEVSERLLWLETFLLSSHWLICDSFFKSSFKN